MFLNYSIRECKDCDAITSALTRLDKKLDSLSNNVYAKEVYLTKSNNKKRQIKDLVYYKQILVHLALNSNYYTGFSSKQIISKIKTLT